mgnify:CR=1 FL=1
MPYVPNGIKIKKGESNAMAKEITIDGVRYVLVPAPVRPTRDINLESIYNRCTAGTTAKQLAAEYGVSVRTIWRRLALAKSQHEKSQEST